MGKQLNYLTENPEIGEETELLPSQNDLVDLCINNINEKLNTFFAIEGGFGSGKTHIATAIATKLAEEKDFNAFQFNVWSTNPASIRSQFLMHLLEPINKESLENKDKTKEGCIQKIIKTFKKRRKELGVELGKPLQKENICNFVLVGIILFITILSLATPIINIFLNPNIPLTIFRLNEPLNWYFIAGIAFALLISIWTTIIFYIHTGGVLFAGSFSIFGLSSQSEREDIDEFNFKKLFNKIVDENTFIILDDIDRITKENIGNTLAFLELLKECSEKIRKEKDIIVSVCVPYNMDQLAFLLNHSITKNALKEKEGIGGRSSHQVYDEDISKKNCEEFIHKIFQKVYKYQFNDSDINVLLKKQFTSYYNKNSFISFINNKEKMDNFDKYIEEIKKIISLISSDEIYAKDNIRQLKRNIEYYCSLVIVILNNKNIQDLFAELNDSINNTYIRNSNNDYKASEDDKFKKKIRLLLLDYINNSISFEEIKNLRNENEYRNISTELRNHIDSVQLFCDNIKKAIEETQENKTTKQ